MKVAGLTTVICKENYNPPCKKKNLPWYELTVEEEFKGCIHAMCEFQFLQLHAASKYVNFRVTEVQQLHWGGLNSE